MFHFGVYIFFITISSTLLGNLDRVMLNYYLGAGAVGLYQAYYFSSIMFVGVLTGIFVQVFFPTAVKLKELHSTLKKLDKVVAIGVACAIVLVPVLLLVILALYHYPFFWLTAAFFTLTTMADIAGCLYSSLLTAQGIVGVRRVTYGLLFAFVFNGALNAFLIPRIGLDGAAIAIMVTFILQTTYVRMTLGALKKHVHR